MSDDLTELEEQLGVCLKTIVVPVVLPLPHVCILPAGHEGTHIYEEYA